MIYTTKANQLQLIIIVYLCDLYGIAYWDMTKMKNNTDMTYVSLYITQYITYITKDDFHTISPTKEPRKIISFKEFINCINSHG